MIPDEIVIWFREIFADINRVIASKIHNVPNVPEPSLDLSFIEHLTHFAVPMKFDSGWSIKIDTHFLGGLAQFRKWEIADIGVFMFFQKGGTLIRQKVVLLQSKRLYPSNKQVQEVDKFDYVLGIGTIADRDRFNNSLSKKNRFNFTAECPYGALRAKDEQQARIEEFSAETGWPVFYNLYNPPQLPLAVTTPLLVRHHWSSNPPLGVRILPSEAVFKMLDGKKKGYAPNLIDMRKLISGTGDIEYGWRLEDFFADMLRCYHGKRFAETDREALDRLFYRRSGPISAAIAVTVEVGDEYRLPD